MMIILFYKNKHNKTIRTYNNNNKNNNSNNETLYYSWETNRVMGMNSDHEVNPRWINKIPNKVFYSKNPYLKIKIDLSGKDPVIKSVNPKLRFKSVYDQKAKS